MTALATRCPECGTTFRLQEEQLRASDGFVRCGRCDAVFDARESLFDLAAPPPPPAPIASQTWAPAEAPTPQPARQSASGQTPARTTQPAPPPWTDEERVEAAPVFSRPIPPPWPSQPDAAPPPPRGAHGVRPTSPSPPPAAAGRPGGSNADNGKDASGPLSTFTGFEPTMMEPLSISPEEVNERLRALLHPDALAADNAPSPVPSKSAKAGGNLGAWASLGVDPSAPSRAQRWRHALAWLAAAGLALALPVQWAWTERAVLRAKSPTFDTAMLRLCPRCTHEPWRHLEGLSVSASSLQPTPQGGAYQLSLTLRNRAAHTLAMPWVELRLSDNKGRPVLRRAISPQELGAKSDRLGGNGTVNLQGSFSLRQGEAINGYEIGLFHP